MAQAGLAVAASCWAVLMGIAPVLQIRRMLREQWSREVSLGYFMILLIGFLLWIAYGWQPGSRRSLSLTASRCSSEQR